MPPSPEVTRLDAARDLFAAAASLPRLWATSRRCGLLGMSRQLSLRRLTRALLEHGAGVRGLHALGAARTPHADALVDDRRTLSYADADAEIAALAAVLRDHLGASRHAPVAVMMENRTEYAVLWFALFRLGIACVHLSRYSTPPEASALLQRSRARVVFVSAATRPVLRDVDADTVTVVDVDAEESASAGSQTMPTYRALLRRGRGQDVRAVGGPSNNVVYTSGTTGRPKGAVRNFGAFGLRTLLEVLERLPLQRGDRQLVVAPLYHSGAQVFALLGAALGGTLVFADGFDAGGVVRLLGQQDIRVCFMVPTMLRRMLELPAQAFVDHPPQLRALVSGAAPFDTSLRERVMEVFGEAAVFDFYGATELGWVTLVQGSEMKARPGSLGRAIPGQEVAIFGDDGRRLGAGEIGRVYTRSAQRMEGYLNDAAATQEIERAGWLTVDDLGYLDEAGHLFLTGRARDMVISGGINIYPAEIEDVLLAHPNVAEAAVVGVPDEQWGERLIACCCGTPLEDAELEAWCRERLAKYKVPKQWRWQETLPRNPTGKILKRELLAALEA